MVDLKKISLIVVVLCAPQSVMADDLFKTFAGCAARFSAAMEHAWLLGEDAQELTSSRGTFVSMLEATLPADRSAEALNYRVAVKMAQATLLTTASFSDDAEKANRARQLSEQYLASCRRLLLDS